MGQHFFAVVRLDKSKIILGAIVAILVIAIAIFSIVKLSGALFSSQEPDYITIQFEKIVDEKEFSKELHTMFPRYFIAGGESYDLSILENHGIEAMAIPEANINHFEKIGVYTIKASVEQIRYYKDDSIVHIYVDTNDTGYEMVTFSKEKLKEGTITYHFVNNLGETITMEEDYIYSTPVNYSILDEGEKYLASQELDQFVMVDSEVKPVISSAGYDIEILENLEDNQIGLYVFGAQILTIQKQGDNLRVYFKESEGYQAISFDTTDLREGQNFAKFVRDSDLKEVETISFWINR